MPSNPLPEPARPAQAAIVGKSEEELALLASEENMEAFDELYRRLQPRLVRFLEARLKSRRTEPEEVAQEAFLKAWTSIAKFDPRYRFSTWLYTIAWRTALDVEKRSRPIALRVVHQLMDSQPSAERQAVAKEQLQNMWQLAESALKPDQYAALWLRYAEDMSVNEIAAVLSKSTISVRVLIHRGRSKMQAVARGVS